MEIPFFEGSRTVLLFKARTAPSPSANRSIFWPLLPAALQRKKTFGQQIPIIGLSVCGKKMSTPSESVMNRREEPTSPTECLWASLAAVESGLSKHGVL